MNLTPQGSQTIEELARRYFVSVDAVMTLLQGKRSDPPLPEQAGTRHI
jgi:hypothetical protein